MLVFLILYLIAGKKIGCTYSTFILIVGFQILKKNLYTTRITIKYFLYYITISLSFFIIVYFSNELRALDDCPRFFPRTYNKFLSTHIKHIQIFFALQFKCFKRQVFLIISHILTYFTASESFRIY